MKLISIKLLGFDNLSNYQVSDSTTWSHVCCHKQSE